MQVSMRMPLSVSAAQRPQSATRRSHRPASASSTSPRRRGPFVETPSDSVVQPPVERLALALQECQRLDRELKVTENSGHTKLGVFARPLGDQQRCQLMATVAKKDTSEHLPDDPVPETFIEDDDVTLDPFFHRFYNDEGQSIQEQLLRTRMRVLALTKLSHGRQSVHHVRALVELADTYARMNLWKQAHQHIMAAHELLKALDAARTTKGLALANQLPEQDPDMSDAAGAKSLAHIFDYFYDTQNGSVPSGEVTVAKIIAVIAELHERGNIDKTTAIAAVFEQSNLQALFGPAPFLHWQQLVLRMERHSPIFQDAMKDMAAVLPGNTVAQLAQAFTQLDPSHFGVVPLHTLLMQLETLSTQDDLLLVHITEYIKQHQERVQYPSITWSEVLVLGVSAISSRIRAGSLEDTARDLRPRLKFFFGRFFLRKGQLEDALRYLQVAVAEEERLHGVESNTLVAYYLILAETLSVRFKQLAVVAQQQAFEIADQWLKSTEGSRRLRARALEVIDETAQQNGTILTKKDAEARAREDLLKEYSALSFVRPDSTMIDDAVEYCTKAWTLQEAAFGREHITTASVHVALAQIYAIKSDWSESVRCYEKAIGIYEASCNGPVPASALLRLEIAKIYHHHQRDRIALAATVYTEVGAFFHSFALEFASSDSTRRDACAQAIEAWRQWLTLATAGTIKSTMDEQKDVLVHVHDATIDGYGEFSVAAAESAHTLAQWLIKMGQLRLAEKYLRTTSYILESHFGPNDRRCRKAKKELVELVSELKGGALDTVDGDHDWLQI